MTMHGAKNVIVISSIKYIKNVSTQQTHTLKHDHRLMYLSIQNCKYLNLFVTKKAIMLRESLGDFVLGIKWLLLPMYK